MPSHLAILLCGLCTWCVFVELATFLFWGWLLSIAGPQLLLAVILPL